MSTSKITVAVKPRIPNTYKVITKIIVILIYFPLENNGAAQEDPRVQPAYTTDPISPN